MNFVKISFAVMLFLLLSSIFIFMLMITQETIGDTFLDEFTNQSVALLDGNPTAQANITSIRADYEEAKLDYNVLFLGGWLLLEFGIISFAINSPKLPQWSFLTLLFFGTLMISFAYSFIIDVTIWFYENFINDTFSAQITYLPFYNFYSEYQILLLIFNLSMALVVNNIWGRGAGTIPDNPFLRGG